MKELTVIELSEQTGLTRSQIYYLNKKHNLINLNEKINYEHAFSIITALIINKAKKANEKNFRQILNMLILQNSALQKQLNLACEREKTYLSELTSCQQSLAQKTTLIPPIDQGNAQSALENGLNNIDENSRNLIQSENEVCVPNESCNGDNTEKESANETGIQPRPTASFQNEMILFELENRDTGPTRLNNKTIEPKDNAYLGAPSPKQNKTQHLSSPKTRKKDIVLAPARIPKNIQVTTRSKVNEHLEMSQDKINNKDHPD